MVSIIYHLFCSDSKFNLILSLKLLKKKDYKLWLIAQANTENNALFIEFNLENSSQQDIMLPSSIRKRHLKISILDENNSNK